MGDIALMDEAIAKLDAINKPERLDRAKARKLNQEGLELLKAKQYRDAYEKLEQAVAADRGSEEVLNNYGFALISVGKLDEADRVLVDTLTLSPRRANAWMNLGMLLAKRSSESKAIEAYITAHRFSMAPEKAVASLVKMASDPEETNPVARNAARLAVERITGKDLAALQGLQEMALPVKSTPSRTDAAALSGQSNDIQPVDARLVECKTLVKAGRRALVEKSYDTAISNANEAISVAADCKGAQELKNDAEREKRDAISRTKFE